MASAVVGVARRLRVPPALHQRVGAGAARTRNAALVANAVHAARARDAAMAPGAPARIPGAPTGVVGTGAARGCPTGRVAAASVAVLGCDCGCRVAKHARSSVRARLGVTREEKPLQDVRV